MTVPHSALFARINAKVTETDDKQIVIPTVSPGIVPWPAGLATESASSTCVAERKSIYQTVDADDVGSRAIENATFPFELLSDIAELESWRKEINRPVYHIHKWWAQRLGSVFRAILLGTFAPHDADVLQLFYQRARLPDAVVFDPFMGSGTTIGEASWAPAQSVATSIQWLIL